MVIKYISNNLNTYLLEEFMKKSTKKAYIDKNCVACGCCVKVCPKDAINIHFGVIAQVDSEKCIGCGKCAKACPAAVITIIEREAAK